MKVLSRINPNVSIHASVKDATSSDNAIKMSGLVSIHASVKDATIVGQSSARALPVSIHASVKDATRFPASRSTSE